MGKGSRESGACGTEKRKKWRGWRKAVYMSHTLLVPPTPHLFFVDFVT